jgi:hypothetical protein
MWNLCLAWLKQSERQRWYCKWNSYVRILRIKFIFQRLLVSMDVKLWWKKFNNESYSLLIDTCKRQTNKSRILPLHRHTHLYSLKQSWLTELTGFLHGATLFKQRLVNVSSPLLLSKDPSSLAFWLLFSGLLNLASCLLYVFEMYLLVKITAYIVISLVTFICAH